MRKPMRALTFCLFYGAHIAFELVQGLYILILLYTVVHNTATCLKICYTILEDHSTNGDASVHFVVGKVKATHSTCIQSAFVLLKLVNELDCFDLGGT